MSAKPELKDGEYYWLTAPAINDGQTLMLGCYYAGWRRENRWYINGQFYTAGAGIEVIRHIPKPRMPK